MNLQENIYLMKEWITNNLLWMVFMVAVCYIVWIDSAIANQVVLEWIFKLFLLVLLEQILIHLKR